MSGPVRIVRSQVKPVIHTGVSYMTEEDAIFSNQPRQRVSFIKPSLYDLVLMHRGTPHEGFIPHSGRWPYGSGDKPFQHREWFEGFNDKAQEYFDKYNGKFNDCIRDLRKDGMGAQELADMLGCDVKTLNSRMRMSSQQFRTYQMAEARRIHSENPTLSNVAIARMLGCNDKTVANYLNQSEDYLNKTTGFLKTVDQLRERVDKYGYVDVGEGNEYWMNITESHLSQAAAILADEGYTLQTIREPRVFGDNAINIQVLAKPGETYSSIKQNLDKLVPCFDPEINNEATLLGLKYPPESLDSRRIGVRYAEDGGTDRDGLIELRRGVADIDLGNSDYAQVRIAVDGTHFIKGIAAYSDDLPPGVDVLVNSNKHRGVPLLDSDPDAKQVLKPMKLDENGNVDQNNPFGATIKSENGQYFYTDANGEQKLSVINKVNDEGDWKEWSRTLSSQMLSKQPFTIAEDQLKLAMDIRKQELENIKSVENPVVREKLLNDYADACDTAAVDLKAAAFPRQSTNIIMPLPNIGENEVYAPNYNNGEHLILIRHPHAIINEIPYLTVNNNSKEGDSLIGKNAPDAIGIHPKTAAQLSGADYDGDTVVAIPADGKNFRYDKPLRDLVGFDPKESYPGYDGMKKMTKAQKGREMGKVTNLITDMNVQGAPPDEMTRAIRHSMVVIDAYKHGLDYKKSEVDNDIASLRKEYQPADATHKRAGGARTLISRASGEIDIPERKEGGLITLKDGSTVWAKVNPETGEKVWSETGKTKHSNAWTDKNGKYHAEKDTPIKVKVAQMAVAKDANELSTGTTIEKVYASYANGCKAQGNVARLEALKIKGGTKVNPAAAKAYSKEVESIKNKIATAKKHSPLERLAIATANRTVAAKLKQDPSIKDDKDELKKIKTQALAGARNRLGGGREKVTVTDKEWEAVEAGAVGATDIRYLIGYMDSKDLKSRTMPRTSSSRGVTDSTRSIVARMARMDYNNAEIADHLGISASTVSSILRDAA